MRLVHKVVVAGAVLAAVVLVGGLFTVLTGRQSLQALDRHAKREAVLQAAVAAMQRDFNNYDDQNNMYILVAATAPDRVQLWQDTYEQAVAAGRQHLADQQATASLGSVRRAQAQVNVAAEFRMAAIAALCAAMVIGVVELILASGDLTRRIGWRRRDELGVLGSSFDSLLDSIRSVVARVADNAAALATNSQLLSTTSQQIAAAAEESSRQAKAVSSTAEDVRQNVQTMAAGSQQMSGSIEEIVRSASTAADTAATAVSATATEAARAGAAGKGFAVVAATSPWPRPPRPRARAKA